MSSRSLVLAISLLSIRSAAITVASLSRNWTTVANPMPELAPVTIPVLPPKRIWFRLLRLSRSGQHQKRRRDRSTTTVADRRRETVLRSPTTDNELATKPFDTGSSQPPNESGHDYSNS